MPTKLSGKSNQLTLLFALIMIIGLWFFVWRQLVFEYEQEMAGTWREEINLVRLYEENVRRVLREADDTLLALREAYQQDGAAGPAVRQIISRTRGEFSRTQVAIVDAGGMMQSLIRPDTAPYDVSDRDYFTAQRNAAVDRLHVGRTMIGRQSGEEVIPLSRRLVKADGSFAGVVVTAVSPAYITESFRLADLGAGKLIVVTGLDGFTRIRQGPGVSGQNIDVRGGPIFQAALAAPAGTLLAANISDGVTRLNAFRQLPEYGLYVNVAMAEDDALDKYRKRKSNYIVAAGWATLIILAFCGLLIDNDRKQRQQAGQITDHANMLAALQETTGRLVTGFEGTANLLQTIVDDAVHLMGAANGVIATVDHAAGTWTIRNGVGVNTQRIGETRANAEGLVGEVIARGELVYVPDYSQYPRRLADARLDSFKSILALPLKIRGEVAGVLTFVWVRFIVEPSEDMVHTLTQYGHLAAVAIERAQTDEEIQRLAFTDILTGLPNRLSVENFLRGEMARAWLGEAWGAVLFVDLDNLKLVNDTMGHSCGDSLIVESGRHILANTPSGAVVGRLAGDEFVVILPQLTDRRQVEEITERLIRSLDRQYSWQVSSVHVAASAGVAFYPEDGSTVEEILKNADAALYVAKNKGKRSWRFYDASVHRAMQETMALAGSLHQALARGELYLNYQPILTPAGLLVGFEALLRWRSPEHGQVSPAVFIPIAEQDGQLIRSLGSWVLREAAIFAGRLAAAGRSDLRVDVNVSARQFEGDDLVANVLDAIAAAGIGPDQLGLEITESVFAESVEHTAAQLKQLRRRGVNISIDDFGEGYSSLAKLSALPVDTLKISRLLTGLLDADPRHFSFVCAIVSMAQALGLTVVAEGVETGEQLMKARECQCDWIQGYYFYRPMPAEEALKVPGQSPA